MCPKTAFGPGDLELLDVAYASAWATLARRDPERAEAVKHLLRLKIVQIAKYGVSDPDTLGGLALDMLSSQPRQTGGQKKRHLLET